jgi:hypothetical protein
VPRLRSDIWIAALIRRAQNDGAYAVLRRRGSDQAGAIFIIVNCLDGRHHLFAPAPQMAFDVDHPSDRIFSQVLFDAQSEKLEQRLDQELQFDPDCWIIEVEDRQERPFADIMKE